MLPNARIPELNPLGSKTPTDKIPIYNIATDTTYYIDVATLLSSVAVSANYDPLYNYMNGNVVSNADKYWLSLQDNNLGHYPAQNTWWLEVPQSVADGSIVNWASGVFTRNPSMVISSKKLYLLDTDQAPLPFYSSNFATELSAGKWINLGGVNEHHDLLNPDAYDDHLQYLKLGARGANQKIENQTIKLGDKVDLSIYNGGVDFRIGLDGYLELITSNTPNDTSINLTAKTIYLQPNSSGDPETYTCFEADGSISNAWLTDQLDNKQSVNAGFCDTCPVLPIDIIRNDATRTLTIATVKGGTAISSINPIHFYTKLNNVRTAWSKETAQSVVWSNTKGLKYIYFDTDGVLKASDTAWAIGNITLVWRLYWNPAETGANRIVREAWECHPNTISESDHRWKHRYGAVWLSGFNFVGTPLTSGSPNASGVNTCISLTGGTCMDDNLPYTVTNSTTPADFNQDLGNETAASITLSNAAIMDITYNAPDGTLTIIPGTRFPFHAIGGVPQIITAGGVITPVVANSFFNYYIYSFQDPRFGKVVNLRSGGQYTTKALADAETWEQIKAASPTLQDGEVRQLYKATFEYRTSYDDNVNNAVLRSFVDLKQNAAVSVTASGSATLDSNVVVSTIPSGFTGSNQSALNQEFATAISNAGGGGGWTENLTAWTVAETTVNLTSNVLRDFGTTPVTAAVNITVTAVTSPKLAEYMFKFVYGTGGSFTYPVGVTLASGNPNLVSGNIYEASILRGKLKYMAV